MKKLQTFLVCLKTGGADRNRSLQVDAERRRGVNRDSWSSWQNTGGNIFTRILLEHRQLSQTWKN